MLVELCIFVTIHILLIKKQILKKSHVALFYTSLICFFYFLPFAAVYGTGTMWSHLVGGNFLICLYAMVGTLSFGVNPLFPKGTIRNVIPKEWAKQKGNTELKMDYEEQDLNSSVKIMNHALKMIPQDISIIKNVMLQNGNNTMTFFDILISPQAIYHLYPCNWGGRTTFTNTGSKKSEESTFDTPDYAIKSVYASDFITGLLSPLKLQRNNIIPVIVTTNKTSRIQGNPSSYKVVNVSHLESYLREPADPVYTSMAIEEIKNVFADAKKR